MNDQFTADYLSTLLSRPEEAEAGLIHDVLHMTTAIESGVMTLTFELDETDKAIDREKIMQIIELIERSNREIRNILFAFSRYIEIQQNAEE